MTARILIVDDVPSNTRLLQAKLAAEYYQTEAVEDGFDALRVARAWQPDVVLLDVMMPGMDGFECCRQLKEDAETLHIPVVMVTALGEPGDRLRGLEAGADDFLTKPVEYDTLMARLRGLVRLKRMMDEWRARGQTARALGLTGDVAGVPSVSGARALVVDDWDLGAELAQAALSREGIVAGRARAIDEAITLSSATTCDLIVLSLSLAAEDPLALASRLRASDATRDTPLLLLAEPDQRDRLLRGLDLGANDWLMRPLDQNELRARARNQIRRKFYQDRLRADLGHALELALTDPLTGLYNQRYLMRHLRGLLAANPPGAIGLMMIDIDRFKLVNDEYGHAVGDQALCAVAERLRGCTRVMDSIARYGGEEFVLVMPGASWAEAMRVAERLRHTIEDMEFAPKPGSRHRLTVSIGIACNDGTPMEAEAILRAADLALYEAKRSGRNVAVLSADLAAAT